MRAGVIIPPDYPSRRINASHRTQLDGAVGRPTQKGGQCADVTNVIVTRLLAVHVFDHARPQCANRPVGRRRAHWGSSRELKVAGPSMLATGCPDRHALPLTPPKTHRPYHALLPRERVRCVSGMLNSSEVKVLYPT